ncbi:MAG: hypothetical protein IRZ08_21610, partial [Frankia sp.]|nr:hypothetical protein [Frankia sp.]
PWALRWDGGAPPPPQTQRRLLTQRLEPADTWHLARTCDQLAAEPDLALWLSDDVGEQLDVGVVVRRDLPDDDADLAQLLRDLPPRDHEVFPAPIGQARELLNRILAGDTPARQAQATGKARLPGWPVGAPAVVVRLRGQDIDVLRPGQAMGEQLPSDVVQPGDLLVLDDRTPVFRLSVVDPAGTTTADDVLEATAGSDASARPLGGAIRVERRTHGDDPLLDEVLLAAIPAAADRPTRADRAALADCLDRLADREGPDRSPVLRWAAGRLRGTVRDTDVIVHGADGPPHRMLVIDTRRLRHDEDLRQTWTGQEAAVPLDVHQEGVADRAAAIATALGLREPAVTALRLAGRHHDDGKTDDRFQVMLRGGATQPAQAAPADSGVAHSQPDPPLAKSGITSPARVRALWRRSGLPAGWRHEQLSVLLAWPALTDEPGPVRDLVARLVGTSHGRGRHGFPHTASELLRPPASPADSQLAQDLFDHGGWDDLIESTTHDWGVWGCAYLEALLRAADGQVSAEGS